MYVYVHKEVDKNMEWNEEIRYKDIIINNKQVFININDVSCDGIHLDNCDIILSG